MILECPVMREQAMQSSLPLQGERGEERNMGGGSLRERGQNSDATAGSAEQEEQGQQNLRGEEVTKTQTAVRRAEGSDKRERGRETRGEAAGSESGL